MRVVAVSLALLVAGTTAAPAQAQAQTPEATYAAQATAATNAQRDRAGLRQLRTTACLHKAAVRQATLMAQREQLFHQDLGAVLSACHLDRAGENIADGYPSGRSVVDDGWMHSEGHRANILDPSFTRIGIGARRGHNGRWYVSQVFGGRA